MSESYRQLSHADSAAFFRLMLTAFAPIRDMGIRFDAASVSETQAVQHLQDHGVYGLFVGDRLAASITLRYPWGPLPGPFGLPHIGWFAADPAFRGQHRGRQLLDWLETHILREVLKAPAVSLGTATRHPWLKEMYLSYGFIPQHETDLGKGHITLFMKKILDDAQNMDKRTPDDRHRNA